MISSEILETDNFLPLILKKELNALLNNGDDDWRLLVSRTYDKYGNTYENWKKYHPLVENDTFVKQGDITKNFPLYQNIKYFTEQKFAVSINKILRIRFVYSPPFNNLVTGYGCPHVDFTDQHHTLLYYFNDNDAETIFFDQKYISFDKIDYTNKKIIHKILPKEGKAVFFNGLIYHAGNVSKLKSRITLNINFTLNRQS